MPVVATDPTTDPNPAAAVSGAGTGRRLVAGAVAGPLFLVVGYAQALTRDGFDLTRHPFSFLALGELGWVQTLNFLVCGAMFVIGASGLARVATHGPGHRWGPRLFGLMGVGCIAGGLFEADPAYGFPAGAPDGMATTMSWHGVMHGPAFGLAILGWVGAALAFARWFRFRGERGWASYSLATALVLLVTPAFMGRDGGVVVLYVTATFGWIWTMALCLKARCS